MALPQQQHCILNAAKLVSVLFLHVFACFCLPLDPPFFGWPLAKNEVASYQFVGPCIATSQGPGMLEPLNIFHVHPGKVTFGTQIHGGLVQMICLFNWVIFRFQPFF